MVKGEELEVGTRGRVNAVERENEIRSRVRDGENEE